MPSPMSPTEVADPSATVTSRPPSMAGIEPCTEVSAAAVLTRRDETNERSLVVVAFRMRGAFAAGVPSQPRGFRATGAGVRTRRPRTTDSCPSRSRGQRVRRQWLRVAPWQPQLDDRAAAIARRERDAAAVRVDDLATERETDAAAGLLRRVERQQRAPAD